MADYKPKQFWGSAQTVVNYSTADISSGNFSPAGTAFDNTSDTSVPYAPYALAVAEFAFVSAPTEGHAVELWALLQDVDGTNDCTDAPSGTASNGAVLLGAWLVDNVTTTQRRAITIDLCGITSFVPYIKNGATVALNCDTVPLVVKITPFTVGVTA